MNKILFLVIICLYSCVNKNPQVEIPVEKKEIGLKGLLIGSEFTNSLYYKYFTSDTSNKPNSQIKFYYIDKLKVSKGTGIDQIGIIESVNVWTYNGKIYHVEFRTGEYSDPSQINFELTDGITLYNSKNGHEVYFSNGNKFRIVVEPMQVMRQGYFYDILGFDYIDYDLDAEIKLKKQNRNDSIKKADYIKEMKQIQN
ncbi:hypothetical protein [Flavobacterium sp. LB1P62]|uniref:hypothetical protein n=1 Tax=Flavobacterium sp. LB1P62 TaxID=3401715 RepID=UPI003AABFA2E